MSTSSDDSLSPPPPLPPPLDALRAGEARACDRMLRLRFRFLPLLLVALAELLPLTTMLGVRDTDCGLGPDGVETEEHRERIVVCEVGEEAIGCCCGCCCCCCGCCWTGVCCM